MNKGEWSEIYALLKLLGTGKIYAADENTERLEEQFFPILKIIKAKKPQEKYEYVIDESAKKVKIFLNGKNIEEHEFAFFEKKAAELYKAIINIKKGEESEAESVISEISYVKLKSNNRSKTDITMQMHDPLTGYKPTSGFSIKSQIGEPATLVNAGDTTNFVYEVTGLTDKDIAEANAISSPSKIRDRIKFIKKKGSRISFTQISNDTFADNLELIDTRFCEVLAHSLFSYYCGNITSCIQAVKELALENPIKARNPDNYYRLKFKQFLIAAALGMKPSTRWTGSDEAEGGCVWVKSDGEVLVYYVWNHNSFENYLLANTKFDTPSSSRHGFGKLYNENGKTYIKLNVQIRFIK